MFWSVLIAGYVVSWAVIPHLLLSKKRPSATLAWVWSILLFPYVGALVYLLLGADRIKRRRLRRAARLQFEQHGESAAVASELSRMPGRTAAMLRALATINRIPSSVASGMRLLVDARAFYPALKERIRQARHHIHIEFFIWRDDETGKEFLELLVEAARRGVQVRLLLDQIGCLSTANRFFDPLIAAGGEFAWFYSLPFGRHSRFINLRNHRKLQIIDGEYAFVGGMNIGREYLGADGMPWRDCQLELKGEVLTFLQETFATDWYFATRESLHEGQYYPPAEPGGGGHLCQVISGGPDTPREPVPKSLMTVLNFAKKRVWISTGYFAPDLPLLMALQICAARGVEVRLLVSEQSDHPYLVLVGRSYYQELLMFGVRVFEYSPGINHSKTILIDEDWMMIGSANSDNRSMRLNFELNVLVEGREEASALEAMMKEDFSQSREITAALFVGRGLGVRLLEAALRPLAPLL